MAARAIVSVGLENFAPVARSFRRSPEKTREAARIAVNETADSARALGNAAIRKQTTLPAKYITDRLTVTKRATLSSLSADVTGRGRATSLARFATNRGDAGKQQLLARVRLKPNKGERALPGSFLVRLRSGKEDLGNIGLAIRVPKGREGSLRKRGARGLVKFGKPTKNSQAYLFYGPSVDQLFDKTRDQIAPAVSRRLELEALRQLARQGLID